jgi:hypothetical protein
LKDRVRNFVVCKEKKYKNECLAELHFLRELTKVHPSAINVLFLFERERERDFIQPFLVYKNAVY